MKLNRTIIITIIILFFSISFVFGAIIGPDDFGYIAYDNTEEDCKNLFSYIDISNTGIPVGLQSVDDGYKGPFPLNFTFPFYSDSFSEFYVGSNGVVYFEDKYLGLGNVCLPGNPGGNNVVKYLAVYHDDLKVQSNGEIYYKYFSSCPVGDGTQRCTIIQFHNIRAYGSSPNDNMDFEVILYPNGTIVYQYASTESDSVNHSNGSSATVGIQYSPTEPPLYALQYSCNEPNLHPNLAIVFAPPNAIIDSIPSICLKNNTTVQVPLFNYNMEIVLILLMGAVSILHLFFKKI